MHMYLRPNDATRHHGHSLRSLDRCSALNAAWGLGTAVSAYLRKGDTAVSGPRLVPAADLLTERVLLVFRIPPEAQTAIILPDTPVDAIAESFVHADGYAVCAADIEIDEERAVALIGDALELVNHFACE